MLPRQNDTQMMQQQNLICECKIQIFVMPATYYEGNGGWGKGEEKLSLSLITHHTMKTQV